MAWASQLAATGVPWTKLDGGLVTISIGRGDAVWGTNSAGQIFRRNGLGAGWEHIPGGAVQASCQDYANAVVVNGADEMFKFNGSGWDVLPGRAKWASMGADGALWCVNAASQIFRHEGGGWVHVEGGAVQVAVGDARNVWVLNGGGELFRWLGGNGWDKVPAPPGITRVAVSAGSERVVALAPGAIYGWAGQSWVHLQGGLTNVAVNERHIVGTNGASEIFSVAIPAPVPAPAPMGMGMGMGGAGAMPVPMGGAHTGGPSWARALAPACNWTKLDGGLVTISIGRGDAVWGTNSAGQIFRRNGLGAGWEHIPGGAVQASCQDYANAVVVNGADEMFKFNGSGWDVLPGRAKWASMGADGALWCVNAASQIFRHEGGGWVHVEGGAVQVAVGDARNVWVLNGGGELFRWLGGNGWDKVPAPPGITRVAVSAGSERVVALAPGAIYAWAGATWVLLPGGLTNVAVNEGHIVGTNGASEIFTPGFPQPGFGQPGFPQPYYK